MKVIGKALVRKPLRLLVYVLILVIASAAILSSVYEYQLIESQMERSLRYYKQSGYLASLTETGWSQKIDPKCSELLAESPYVAYLNEGKAYRGQMQDIVTDTDAFSWAYNGANTYFLYGRLLEKEKQTDDRLVVDYTDESFSMIDRTKIYPRSDLVRIEVLDVLGGEEERLQDENLSNMAFSIPGEEEELDAAYEEMEVGSTYLFQVYKSGLASLEYGNIFGIVTKVAGTDTFAYPVESEEQIAEVLTENPELKQAMDRLEENLHMFRVIGVQDMNMLPTLQMDMYYLEDGRLLYETDTEEENAVCVISNRLADCRGLQIGDKLKITVGDVGASNRKTTLSLRDHAKWSEWESAQRTEMEVEIVGLLDSRLYEGKYAEDRANDIYVPMSLLPESFREHNAEIYTDLFGFVLNDPSEAEAFRAEYEPILKVMGYQLVLSECDWETFFAAAADLKSGKLIEIAVLGVLSWIVMGIVLVLMRRALKKELLILRLLGVSQKSVARQFFGTAGIVGILSIVAGAGIAYVYAGYAVKRSLGAVDEALVGGKLDAMQSMIVAGIVVLIFVVTLLSVCLQHFRGTPMSKMQKTNKQ